MKVILIYAIKPELIPLKFVKDKSDALDMIQSKIALAEEQLRGKQERADRKGGEVPMLGLTRWKSARCVEVNIDMSQ